MDLRKRYFFLHQQSPNRLYHGRRAGEVKLVVWEPFTEDFQGVLVHQADPAMPRPVRLLARSYALFCNGIRRSG